MSIRVISKNILSLSIGQGICRIIGFFIFVFIARYLGAEDFGKYSLALSFVVIFNILANFGLDTLFVKDVSRDKSLSSNYLGMHLALKSTFSLISIFIVIIITKIMGYSKDTSTAIIIFAISILFYALLSTFSSLFQAYEKMEYASMIDIIKSLIVFLLTISFIYMKLDLFYIISAQTISAIITFLIVCYIGLRYFTLPQFSLNISPVKDMTIKALPFLTMGVLVIIYTKIDIVMLSKIKSEEYVGWYSAAIELIFPLYLVPNIFLKSLFPSLSRQFVESGDKLKKTYMLALKLLILLGVPISSGIFVLSPKIILFFYNESYRPSISALQILCFLPLFSFPNILLGDTLTAMEKVKTLMLINLIGCIFNIIMNLFLIPIYGHIGAAIATVLSVLLCISISNYILSKNLNGIQLLRNYIKPFISSLIMTIFLYKIMYLHINLFLMIILGAVIYTVILYFLNPFTKEEMLMLNFRPAENYQ